MAQHIFYPPPMPQRTTPPRVYYTPGDITIPPPDTVPVGIRDKIISTIIQQYFKDPSPTIPYTRIATLLPSSLGNNDLPPFRRNNEQVYLVLPSYVPFLYIPRTTIKTPLDILQERHESLPFTRKDLLLYSEHFFKSDYGVEYKINYLKGKRYYTIDNPAPIFTSGYLIAFQPNAFQIDYPGPYNAFQGMNRFIEVGDLVVRDWLVLELGPIMTSYQRGSAVVFEARVFDPVEIPPLPYNPEGVFVTLTTPAGVTELNQQSMSNIENGLYRYIWQSDSSKELGFYKYAIQAISGPNLARTIIQGAFRLVDAN